MVKEILIKDAYVPELIEVFGRDYNDTVWDTELTELIPNPQTKAQFADAEFDREMVQFIKKKVMRYRTDMATSSIDLTEITE